MNHLTEILNMALTEEPYKSREVTNGNKCNQEEHTNVHSLTHTPKGRSGIVKMKKRYRRYRLLLAVILLSGIGLSCDRLEAKEHNPASLIFSTDVDIIVNRLDFQIERTDFLEHSSSAVVCGCYWFEGEKVCFTNPGYICNVNSKFLQVQIPKVSQQHGGKYQLRILKGVHMTPTCILRIQDLNFTTPEPISNDARWSTTLTPDPPGRNGDSRVTEIIIACCVAFILAIFGTTVFIVYKRKAIFQFLEKRNKFVNANDTKTPNPGTEDRLINTDTVRMLP